MMWITVAVAVWVLLSVLAGLALADAGRREDRRMGRNDEEGQP